MHFLNSLSALNPHRQMCSLKSMGNTPAFKSDFSFVGFMYDKNTLINTKDICFPLKVHMDFSAGDNLPSCC